jgi:hypothetical protein
MANVLHDTHRFMCHCNWPYSNYMMCPTPPHQRGLKIPFITDHAGFKMFAVPVIYITLQQRDKNEVKFGIC